MGDLTLLCGIGSKAVLVTGGSPGVPKAFAQACGPGAQLFNICPTGVKSDYGVGTDIHTGRDEGLHKDILRKLGDVYLAFDGCLEAQLASERGACIIPLVRSGMPAEFN